VFFLDIPLADVAVFSVTMSTPGFPFRIRLVRGKREVN
jgi:hypothetical protein